MAIQGERPGVVVASLSLHDVDWRYVTRLVWELGEAMPMILMTDRLTPKLAYSAQKRGIDWVLQRPLDELAVVRAVGQAWRKAMLAG
jgi:FixJ family two-component response regulator